MISTKRFSLVSHCQMSKKTEWTRIFYKHWILLLLLLSQNTFIQINSKVFVNWNERETSFHWILFQTFIFTHTLKGDKLKTTGIALQFNLSFEFLCWLLIGQSIEVYLLAIVNEIKNECAKLTSINIDKSDFWLC